jgi:hypothetical protein
LEFTISTKGSNFTPPGDYLCCPFFRNK